MTISRTYEAPLYDPERDGPAGLDQRSDLAETLRQIWSAVLRSRYLVIAIVVTCLVMGFIVTALSTPRYSATARLLIDQETTKVLGTEDVTPLAGAQETDRFLQTEVDVLKSRPVAEQVMASLNLADNDQFVTAMNVKPVTSDGTGRALTTRRREQVLGLLADNLRVDLPRNSRIVGVNFTSPNPVVAARIANSFASTFIVMNIRRKFNQSSYARGFLQQQLISAKQRLEDSERAMLEYARSVGLIDASAGIGASDTGAQVAGARSLVTSDLVTLNSAYATARANRVAAEQRWSQAQRSPLFSLPEVLSNGAFNELVQERGQVEAAYAQERQHRKPDFPSLQALGARLTSLDRQMTSLASSIRDGIHDRFDTARKQEMALAANVEVLKRDTQDEQERSVRYNILKRETDTNRTMYDGLLQRFKEISAEAGVSPNNISVVEPASTPTGPNYPRPMINMLVSAIIGLALAGGVIFIREKFDDVVRRPDDVQQKLGLPLLSAVPLLEAGETPTSALSSPRSPLSESYAALRTSLELANADGMPRTLLFTSSRAGEGKSTSAYAIARDFARIGRRVVLVDGDLRRPSLHRIFGVPHDRGLSNALAQQYPVLECVSATDMPNLNFMSAGPIPPNPADLLFSSAMRHLLSQLLEEFELIIVDGPPVFGLADAVMLSSVTDGTVFVIEANGANHGNAKAALRRLRTGGSRILGALLTKHSRKSAGYGYSYYQYDYGGEANGDQ